MVLENIVNFIFSREPKYDSVIAQVGSGMFSLSAERDGREVDYSSHKKYSITTTSPILRLLNRRWGGPLESTRWAPEITIRDPVKNETAHILYDSSDDVVMVRLEDREGSLQIVKYGSQVLCSDPSMSDKDALRIASGYRRTFKQQERLLGVKAHKKSA